jgi:hypothetical protein
MTEQNDPQFEPKQETKKELEPFSKDEIKKEIKEEMKQDFFHYKKRKYILCLKFLIVFIVGLGIGLFAGHHGHGYRHGDYFLQRGHHIPMQRGNHMGGQLFNNQNGVPGE